MTVKGLPFELVPVRPPNLGVTPEFIKMNPNRLVPVLQEGDFSIFEGCVSRFITRFLSIVRLLIKLCHR
jgi:glutathione S-transferase